MDGGDELDRAKRDKKFCDTKLEKTSKAISELQSFAQGKPDPFAPDFTGENQWVGKGGGGGGGGGCTIL